MTKQEALELMMRHLIAHQTAVNIDDIDNDMIEYAMDGTSENDIVLAFSNWFKAHKEQINLTVADALAFVVIGSDRDDELKNLNPYIRAVVTKRIAELRKPKLKLIHGQGKRTDRIFNHLSLVENEM